MKKHLIIALLSTLIFSCGTAQEKQSSTTIETSDQDKVVKTVEEWKQILSEEEFQILRESGTERAFTGDLLDNKKEGTYTCAGCDLPLFTSDTKFKSGTGWPSFFDEIDENVTEDVDNSYGMRRTELLCKRCDGHLGHVFDDGPKPTGLRYCINSASLNFEEKKDN